GRTIQLARPAGSDYPYPMVTGSDCNTGFYRKVAPRLLLVLLPFILNLDFSSNLFAQTKLGRLVVQLSDESGSAVAGVEALLQSGEIHLQQKSLSNSSGELFFRGLPYGAYLLTIEDSRFEPVHESLSISNGVSKDLHLTLKVHALVEQVTIADTPPLMDPQKTNSSLYRGEEQIQRRLASMPNRDTVNMVASLPGWVLENSGVLHPRGSEYQTQYVLDGIPVLENRSPAFASGPLLDSTESMEVITGGIPAEYGRKLGGVINVSSQPGNNLSHGSVGIYGGSEDLLGGAFVFGGQHNQWGYSAAFSGSRSNRYLDPPDIQNYHNQGNTASGSMRLDYLPQPSDSLHFFAWGNGTGFEVPNEPFQQEAGQDQTRSNRDMSLNVSWDHYQSAHAMSNVAAYARSASTALDSNLLSTPVTSYQRREFQSYGGMGSYSWIAGHHQFKAGGDILLTPIQELFHFTVTDPGSSAGGESLKALSGMTLLQISTGEPFYFFDRQSCLEWSGYFQDHFNWKNWSFNLGIRYDNYRFLIHDSAWSPRIGIGYFIPRTQTRFHVTYDRAFQTPSNENLLLSSSEQAQAFSPLRGLSEPGGLPVPTSRGNFYEAGISQALGKRVRLDTEVFQRQIGNFADDDVFLNTGINFPISLSRAQIKGAEARLELQNWKRLSGYVSYSYLLGFAYSPVTGGLFLGDSATDLIQPGLRFPISQDQRNTLHTQIQYQPPSGRWWLAAGFTYASGLPVEINEGSDLSAVDPRILDQVNLERGRVKPYQLWDLSGGMRVWESERQRMIMQADWINVADRFYLINFSGLFSETTIGLPSTVSVKLTYQF
ncbi:MAG: TonB-dependent receptor, partial [Terriglobia bacterium]